MKKLQLKKEVVAMLNDKEAGLVHGGGGILTNESFNTACDVCVEKPNTMTWCHKCYTYGIITCGNEC